MSRFEWKPEYSVENDPVDEDHRGFFELASELDADHLKDGELGPHLADVLSRLETYAREHFAREEALMAAINYPELEPHRQSHDRFRTWLADARAQSDGTAETARRIADFTEKWLVEHILNDDMRYRDYILMKH